MKSFIASVVVMIAVAYGAAMILNQNFQSTAYATHTTEGARLGEPGTNLVGPNWDGLNRVSG